MTVTAVLEILKGFARRQWLIVCIAALVAAGIGFVVAGEQPDRYVAESTIQIDSPALRRFTGLIGPEGMLAAVVEDEFIEAAAERVGASPDEVRRSVTVYTAGIPIKMYVQYESEQQAEAERNVVEVAQLIPEWHERLAFFDIDKQRIIVDDSRVALEALEGALMDSEWERTDLEYKLWNVRRELALNEAILFSMEQVYTVQGEPVVSTISGARERLIASVGAGVLGLFLGLVAGAIRERRMIASR